VKYRPAVYHSQQCAEKALKAYLIYKLHPLVKVHDLIALTRLCKRYDPDFNNFLDLALSLDGLDVEYRYPVDDGSSIFHQPLEDKVQESLDNAKEILDFVKSKCI
jgi:HEPN domain-containing protein